MRLNDEMRVDLETAKQRALDCLDPRYPRAASSVADFIWPEHRMRGQGAGAAASRVLKRLEKDGKARWTASRINGWGWVST